MRWLIDQIGDAGPKGELLDARITVLKEYVKHHVKEEEEELFPKLLETKLDLDAIGKRLKEAREAHFEEMGLSASE